MAHKKAGSSSKNGRDSVGQRLGVKVGDGQLVPAGASTASTRIRFLLLVACSNLTLPVTVANTV